MRVAYVGIMTSARVFSAVWSTTKPYSTCVGPGDLEWEGRGERDGREGRGGEGREGREGREVELPFQQAKKLELKECFLHELEEKKKEYDNYRANSDLVYGGTYLLYCMHNKLKAFTRMNECVCVVCVCVCVCCVCLCVCVSVYVFVCVCLCVCLFVCVCEQNPNFFNFS